MFVQIYGEKLFTLFPPSASDDMYMFPRIHPLWHKSQVEPPTVGGDLLPADLGLTQYLLHRIGTLRRAQLGPVPQLSTSQRF